MNFDDNIWLKQQKFIVFGAGKLGKDLIESYKNYNIILGFIDNDIEKQKTGYLGFKVWSFEEYMNKYYDKYKIILACSLQNKKIIEHQMINANLKPKIDFIYIDEFITMFKLNLARYHFKYFNKNYMNVAQISVTERCTLNCKKCAHGCYNVPNNAKDLDLSEVKKSADSFFAHIDYIEYFHLIGGEPFLYSELSEAIIYIGENYRKQIKNFCITTNGTILPKDDILKIIKKYNMKIMISNYSHTLPYLKSKYEQLLQTLDKHEIDYMFNEAELIWTDYGFDYVDRGFFKEGVSEEKRKENLQQVLTACKTPCREIRGNKLYYCIQARTCRENMRFSVGQDDYLDLSKLDKSQKSKKILMDFEMGIFPKGYLDMCNYCNGGERYKFPIPAAEQMK